MPDPADGLTRATRFINVLDLGPAATKEDPEPWKRGFEVSLQIPIFDWGSARVARAEAIYMQALHRVAETAVNARSEVREAYSAYHTAYDTAKHYRDEIVPLRKKIGRNVHRGQDTGRTGTRRLQGSGLVQAP